MRKLIAHLHVGYAGMDAIEAFVVEDDTSETEIYQIVHDMALINAENFGYYPPCDFDTDEEYVSEGIDGWWEEYNPDQHDMHRAGGGSFENDFKGLTP